jgi:hypothetical protein
MNRAERATRSIDAMNCRHSWIVFVSRYDEKSETDEFNQRLDESLAELEATDRLDFSCTDQLSYAIESVRKMCDELSTIRGQVFSSLGRPKIIIQAA